jgi:hypothetical protein
MGFHATPKSFLTSQLRTLHENTGVGALADQTALAFFRITCHVSQDTKHETRFTISGLLRSLRGMGQTRAAQTVYNCEFYESGTHLV